MGLGSGLWKNQKATLAHLIVGKGGLSGEVMDVRLDIAAVLTPLVAVAIEEYLLPQPALPTAIMPVTATLTTAQTYRLTALSGSIGQGAISPPRNITVTTAGTTATDAPATATINGLDAQGNVISETITGVNAGAATYSTKSCFARVTSVVFPAAAATDATVSVGTGIIIGLSQTPKLRAGQLLPLVRREVVDGSVVTTGVYTLPATNPPYGAYTPASAPATPAAAVVTGTTNVTSAALYGSGGTLAGGGTGLTLILTVGPGASPLTLTFSGTGVGNDASSAAMLAAIMTEWPALTATINGSNELVLTTNAQGTYNGVITVGAGTANTALGLTAATTHGTGHLYAHEYEYDATLQKNYPTYSPQ